MNTTLLVFCNIRLSSIFLVDPGYTRPARTESDVRSNLGHRDHKLDHQNAHVRRALFSLTEDFPYLQGRLHL